VEKPALSLARWHYPELWS